MDRVIITFDVEFGHRWFRWSRGRLGKFLLRLGVQRIERITIMLKQFLGSEDAAIDLNRIRVVIDDRKVRIVQR